jgi:hypothetical protein
LLRSDEVDGRVKLRTWRSTGMDWDTVLRPEVAVTMSSPRKSPVGVPGGT